jgi:hypothetical protein
MIWICVSRSGSYDVAMLPPEERLNRNFFTDEVLKRYDEHRRETRKKNRSYFTFAHWHACPHLVQSKFDSMGIHRLLHPLCTPDVAPCNFSRFGYVEMKLERIFFETLAAVLAEVEEMFGDISITEWVKVFDEQKDRLKRCIDAEGHYLEND